MHTFQIGERSIGPGRPVYVVAELSANHNRSFDEAVRLIHAAKNAGADAVKLQTYRADTLTLDCDSPWFRIGKGSPWQGRRLYDLYAEAYTPWEWHAELQQVALAIGLDFFSTPFDSTAVDFLEDLRVPVYKIASFEIVDLELIRRVATNGKPMILSTGMASMSEIEEALQVARGAGATQFALLRCTSAYPAPPEAAHLATIADLANRFDVVAGLSDHTMGLAVPVIAVALGAAIIEKHFTLSRAIAGPDSTFSLEPNEFRDMVDAIRIAEKAIGRVHYGVGQAEAASHIFRRSLFVSMDVRAGERFTPENVRSVRPGSGLSPKHLPEVLERCAVIDLPRGTPLTWQHLL